MNVTVTYTSRLRESENIEVIVKYKKRNSKVISNIALVNSYLNEGNVRYEKRANKFWVLLFNLTMLCGSAKYGNKILDKMLEKAKKYHQ